MVLSETGTCSAPCTRGDGTEFAKTTRATGAVVLNVIASLQKVGCFIVGATLALPPNSAAVLLIGETSVMQMLNALAKSCRRQHHLEHIAVHSPQVTANL